MSITLYSFGGLKKITNSSLETDCKCAINVSSYYSYYAKLAFSIICLPLPVFQWDMGVNACFRDYQAIWEAGFAKPHVESRLQSPALALVSQDGTPLPRDV